ncbi:hypothetical protein ACWEV3_39800 [Saccharopolyspora sp. NPDC003752]
MAVLADGVLQQCVTPRGLYECPANLFVAGLIGTPAINFLNLSLQRDGVAIGELTVPLPGRCSVMLRTAR